MFSDAATRRLVADRITTLAEGAIRETAVDVASRMATEPDLIDDVGGDVIAGCRRLAESTYAQMRAPISALLTEHGVGARTALVEAKILDSLANEYLETVATSADVEEVGGMVKMIRSCAEQASQQIGVHVYAVLDS